MRARRRRSKKKLFWGPIVLIALVALGSFILILFLGLHLLAKLSLVLERIGGEEINVVSDQTPPFPPQLEFPFSATNSARITLRGVSEPNSTVKLSLNDQALEKVLIGKDGTFTKRLTLKEGENSINAQAIDQAGNKSKPSTPITIFYKKSGPLLEIEFPPEEDFQTSEDEVEIKGKTDPDVDLNINGRFVFVENDGSFVHLVSLSEGENLIEAIAIDQAGNQTKTEVKITFSP